jgi:hypothetical protein
MSHIFLILRHMAGLSHVIPGQVRYEIFLIYEKVAILYLWHIYCCEINRFSVSDRSGV